MALTGKTNEEKIWNYFKAAGLTDHGAAGLMGNLYAESSLKANNLQNSFEKKLGYTDAGYTAAVDSGKYQLFETDGAGYGLAQWTFCSRKAELIDYAKSCRKSIGDLEMQLDFLMKELREAFKKVLAVLTSTASVQEASDIVLTQFERPADMGAAVKAKRAGYGKKYYDKYASGPAEQVGGSNMTENDLRKKVVEIAVSYLGCKESDGSHKKIIDLYNSHKPLARGYAVKYTDAWCSTFASAVAIAAGMTDIIPAECGCEKHIALFKKLKAWVEDDKYVPAPGDYIFYDWADGTDYAETDNTGSADHVGIVTAVSGDTITVIEGNISNAVGYRKLKVNGRYIRGYGVPDYAKKATAAEPEAPSAGTGLLYAVGDIVEFTGTKHYASANATTGPSCKPGKAKVTQTAKGAKHPYHLVKVTGGGSTVYGWVDTADIDGSSSNVNGYRTHKVVKGDTLWGLASTYLGNGSRYKEIMTLNGMTSATIKIGQVLKIPAK